MSKKRVVFIAKIDPVLKDEFYKYIKAKYRGLRGGISAELEHMIAERMREEHTQITHMKLNPVDMPMRHIVANEIMANLRQQGFWNQCSEKILYDAIRDLRGSDQRTIIKWVKELTRMGRIKRINASIFELIG